MTASITCPELHPLCASICQALTCNGPHGGADFGGPCDPTHKNAKNCCGRRTCKLSTRSELNNVIVKFSQEVQFSTIFLSICVNSLKVLSVTYGCIGIYNFKSLTGSRQSIFWERSVLPPMRRYILCKWYPILWSRHPLQRAHVRGLACACGKPDNL